MIPIFYIKNLCGLRFFFDKWHCTTWKFIIYHFIFQRELLEERRKSIHLEIENKSAYVKRFHCAKSEQSFFTHLKLCLATATDNFKWMKMNLI